MDLRWILKGHSKGLNRDMGSYYPIDEQLQVLY